MGLLSFLGFGSSKLNDALRNHALIIDVRTAAEYDRGHIPEALNIPVDRINVSIQRIKGYNKPVILCCNSGARSSTALQILKANGLKEVYNGRNWENVMRLIKKFR